MAAAPAKNLALQAGGCGLHARDKSNDPGFSRRARRTIEGSGREDPR
jgi:hypothetical protein